MGSFTSKLFSLSSEERGIVQTCVDNLAFPIKTGCLYAFSKPFDSQPETSPALNDFYTSSLLPLMWKDLSKSSKKVSALRITDKDFSPPNGMCCTGLSLWVQVRDCTVPATSYWKRKEEQGGRLWAHRTMVCYVADKEDVLWCGCVHTHTLYVLMATRSQ